MRALVTGSSGFVGCHMVRELETRGYEVWKSDINRYPGYVHAHMTPHNYIGNALDGFLQGNSRGSTPWEYRFDLVVHAGYMVGGRAAIDGINTNFMQNIALDSLMFQWAIETRQRRVLYFSSSAAYPVEMQAESFGPYRLQEDDINLDIRPFRAEPDIVDGSPEPDANYGWAKLTGERLAADARSNGLEVSVVRPFSGYGEDQSDDYPFPSIVKRAAHDDLSVWGPPGQTRDWIHIDDVVNGALAVVESGTTDPINLCTGRGVEMGTLAQLIYQLAFDANCRCCEVPQPTYDESRPTGVFYRVGDPTRMLQYYQPKVSLEDGIRRALGRTP